MGKVIVKDHRGNSSLIHIGNGVRKAQTLSGVTNEQISEHLSVSRMQVHRYRTQPDMRFSTMCEIAKLCDISIYELIDMSWE